MSEKLPSPSATVDDKKFDCFLSYSTDPDYKLVSKVEKFLESFHKNFSKRQQQELGIRPLQVCVDESDLEFEVVAEGSDISDPITQAIERGLGLSKWLIVFCSKNAMGSTWVSDEISWWESNFGTGRIKLVLTDPDEQVKGLFSSQIQRLELADHPWIDLRGWKTRKTKSDKVRDSYEQLVQLASLLQDPPRTKGELWPAWKREYDRKNRRKLVMFLSLIVLSFLSIAGGLGLQHWFLRSRAIEVLGTFNATFSDQSTVLWINYPPSKPKHSWQEFQDSVECLPSLSVFRVVDCQFETIDFLSEHSQLKELGLNNCSKIKNFSVLSKLKKLTFLDLGETSISNADVSEIEWPLGLKEASFCRCKNLTSVGVGAVLKRCHEITELKLSAKDITADVLEQLTSFSIERFTIDGKLTPDLLSAFKHRNKVHFVGVEEATGPLL